LPALDQENRDFAASKFKNFEQREDSELPRRPAQARFGSLGGKNCVNRLLRRVAASYELGKSEP
jgi:hypothetical protein